MLVSPEGQSKQLTIDEVGGPRLYGGRDGSDEFQSHQEFEVEKDTPFAQGDWTAGLGQLEYDYKNGSGYWWGSGVVTHIDGHAYLAPPALTPLALPSSAGTAIVGFYTYYNYATLTRYDFCWSSVYLYRRITTDSTTAWVLVWTEPNAKPITDFCVFNGIGVICTPTEVAANVVDFWTQADVTAGATWSPTKRDHSPYSDALGRPKFAVPVRGTLFTAVDTQKIFYTVDQTTDGAAGPITATVGSITAPEVGDSTYPFTKLFAANDYLYAFKQSAGYAIDSQQNVTETFWQWKDKPSPENFKFVTSGGDLLYYSVGPEVYAYDPGTGANPALKLSKQSGFSVQSILGLGADNQYVYVLAQVRVPTLRTVASVVLLRGTKLSGARYAFECLWEDNTYIANSRTYYGLTAAPNGVGTRLYWGTTISSVTSTYIMEIPADFNESTGTSFATTGDLYTSITRAAFPGLSKRHLWVAFQTEGTTGASFKVAVAYSLDNGATFTALGDTGSGGSGVLLSKLDYANVSSRSIVLRWRLTSTGASTPVLRVFDHHQRVRFKYLPTIGAGIRVADHVENNAGKPSAFKAPVIKTQLENMRSEEGQMLYEDFLGNSFYVSMSTLKYRPTRHERPGVVAGGAEMEASVVFDRADSGA